MTYTLRQCSIAVGLSVTVLLRQVKAGKLIAHGRPKRVNPDDLLAFLAMDRKVGRPRIERKPKRPRGRPRKTIT